MVQTITELKKEYQKNKNIYNNNYITFLLVCKQSQEKNISLLKEKNTKITKLYKTEQQIQIQIQNRTKLLNIINNELKKIINKEK